MINIPDTVGYTTPEEMSTLIRYIIEHTENIDKITLATHCHDDLGMAVANSLAAVKAGVSQIECTINGIGERAGNCAMEEAVMALHTRKDFFDAECRIDTAQIYRTSKFTVIRDRYADTRKQSDRRRKRIRARIRHTSARRNVRKNDL